MTIDKPGSISSIPNRPEEQAVREKNEKVAEVRPENTDAVRSSIKADNSEALQEASRAERVADISRQVKSGTYQHPSDEEITKAFIRSLF